MSGSDGWVPSGFTGLDDDAWELLNDVRQEVRTEQERLLEQQITFDQAVNTADISAMAPVASADLAIASSLIGMTFDDPQFIQVLAREQMENEQGRDMLDQIWDTAKVGLRNGFLGFQTMWDEGLPAHGWRTGIQMSNGYGFNEAFDRAGASAGAKAVVNAIQGRKTDTGTGILPGFTPPSESPAFAQSMQDLVEQQKSGYGDQLTNDEIVRRSLEAHFLDVGQPVVPMAREVAESTLIHKTQADGSQWVSPFSPGRAVGINFYAPGSKPFKVLSGGIDFTAQIVADPTNIALAGWAKARKVRRAFAPDVPQGLDSAAVGQLLEQRSQVARSGGLFGNTRFSVHQRRATDWALNEGRVLRDFLTRNDDIRAVDAILPDLDASKKAALVRAQTIDEVDAILLPELGTSIINVPGGRSLLLPNQSMSQVAGGLFPTRSATGRAVGRSAGMGARIGYQSYTNPIIRAFSDMHRDPMMASDPDGAFATADAFMRNGGFDPDVAADFLLRIAENPQYGTEGLFAISTDMMKEYGRVLVDKYNWSDDMARAQTELFEGRTIARLYNQDDLGHPVILGLTFEFGDTASGVRIDLPEAHILSEYLDWGVALPDARSVRVGRSLTRRTRRNVRRSVNSATDWLNRPSFRLDRQASYSPGGQVLIDMGQESFENTGQVLHRGHGTFNELIDEGSTVRMQTDHAAADTIAGEGVGYRTRTSEDVLNEAIDEWRIANGEEIPTAVKSADEGVAAATKASDEAALTKKIDDLNAERNLRNDSLDAISGSKTSLQRRVVQSQIDDLTGQIDEARNLLDESKATVVETTQPVGAEPVPAPAVDLVAKRDALRERASLLARRDATLPEGTGLDSIPPRKKVGRGEYEYDTPDGPTTIINETGKYWQVRMDDDVARMASHPSGDEQFKTLKEAEEFLRSSYVDARLRVSDDIVNYNEVISSIPGTAANSRYADLVDTAKTFAAEHGIEVTALPARQMVEPGIYRIDTPFGEATITRYGSGKNTEWIVESNSSELLDYIEYPSAGSRPETSFGTLKEAEERIRSSYETRMRKNEVKAGTETIKEEAVNVAQERAARPLPDGSTRIDPATGGRDFWEGIFATNRDHPLGPAVTVYPEEVYLDPTNLTYLAEDGMAGAVVTKDGDLVSVFRHPDSTTDMKKILEESSAEAVTGDTYDIDGFLPDLYAEYGFRPVARVKFSTDPDLIPDNWDRVVDHLGPAAAEPDIVLFVKDVDGVTTLPSGKYADVRDSVPLVEYDDAYALQQQYRQEVIDAGGPSRVTRVGEREPFVPRRYKEDPALIDEASLIDTPSPEVAPAAAVDGIPSQLDEFADRVGLEVGELPRRKKGPYGGYEIETPWGQVFIDKEGTRWIIGAEDDELAEIIAKWDEANSFTEYKTLKEADEAARDMVRATTDEATPGRPVAEVDAENVAAKKADLEARRQAGRDQHGVAEAERRAEYDVREAEWEASQAAKPEPVAAADMPVAEKAVNSDEALRSWFHSKVDEGGNYVQVRNNVSGEVGPTSSQPWHVVDTADDFITAIGRNAEWRVLPQKREPPVTSAKVYGNTLNIGTMNLKKAPDDLLDALRADGLIDEAGNTVAGDIPLNETKAWMEDNGYGKFVHEDDSVEALETFMGYNTDSVWDDITKQPEYDTYVDQTSRLGDFLNKVSLKELGFDPAVATTLLDWYQTFIFKPLALLRAAWFARVTLEENVRMWLEGFDSFVSHPFSAIQWTVNHNLTSRVTTGRPLKGRTGVGKLEDVVDEAGEVAGRTHVYGDDLVDSRSEHEVLADVMDQMRIGRGGQNEINYGVVYKGNKNYVQGWTRDVHQLTSTPELAEISVRGVDGTVEWMKNTPEGIAMRERIALDTSPNSPKRAIMDNEAALRQHLESIEARAHRVAGGEYHVKRADGQWVSSKNVNEPLATQPNYPDSRTYIIVQEGDAEVMKIMNSGKFGKVEIRGNQRITRSEYRQLEKFLDGKSKTGVGPGSVKGIADDRWQRGKAVYDAIVGTAFNWLGSKPTNYLSRSPFYRQAHWDAVGRLYLYADDELRAFIMEAVEHANIGKVEWTKIVNRHGSVPTGTRVLTIDDAGMVDDLAKAQALERTRKTLYDLSKRKNLSDMSRFIFPFGEAFVEMITVWSRLVAQNPHVLRRGQQMVNGARSSGFFYENDYGEEVFTVPGSGALSRAIGLAPDGAQLSTEMTVQGMNMVTSNPLPAFGVVPQVSASMVLPQSGTLAGIAENVIFGGYGRPDTPSNPLTVGIDAVVPPWFRSLWTGIGAESSDWSQTYAAAVNDIVEVNSITGAHPGMSQGDQAGIYADARKKAFWMFIVRGVESFGSPSAPQLKWEIETADGSLMRLRASKDIWNDVLRANEYDRVAATEEFLVRVGFDPNYMYRAHYEEKWERVSTDAGYLLEQQNPDQYDQFPATAAFAFPDPPWAEFSFNVHRQRQLEGDKRVVDSDTHSALINAQGGDLEYRNMQNRLEWRLSEMRASGVPERTINDYQEKVQRSIVDWVQQRWTGWGKDGDVGAYQELSPKDLWREVTTQHGGWFDDPAMMATDAGQGLEAFMPYWDAAVNQAVANGLSPTGWLTSDKAIPTQMELRGIIDQISEQHPDFRRLAREAIVPRMTASRDLWMEENPRSPQIFDWMTPPDPTQRIDAIPFEMLQEAG